MRYDINNPDRYKKFGILRDELGRDKMPPMVQDRLRHPYPRHIVAEGAATYHPRIE